VIDPTWYGLSDTVGVTLIAQTDIENP